MEMLIVAEEKTGFSSKLLSMFVIILLLVSTVNSTTDFFIFWGYPTSETDNCVNTASTSFNSCVASCQNSQTCMLSYGNDAYCMLCDLFTLHSITQSNEAGGVKVAIKIDEPTDGCPTSMESEEFSGTNSNNNTYFLKYSNGIWDITYTNLSCLDSTWTKFYRPAGQFCLKVFGSPSTINRNASRTYCANFGAGLAGIQSEEEMDFITEESKNLTGSRPTYLYTATWVNGLRPNSCNFDKAELTSECAGLKSFVITDSFMTSTSQYNFAPGFPDSVIDRDVRRDCLQIFMSQNQTSWQGLLGDAVCEYPCNTNGSICATSYICGLPAK